MTGTLCPRVWLGFAGLSGAVTVAVDAYARHHLDPVAASYGRELVGIAVRYQGLHALTLIVLALLVERAAPGCCRRAVQVAGWCFVAGTLLFCGTLYALAAGASPDHAITAPWGGSSFIVGWLALAVAGARWGR